VYDYQYLAETDKPALVVQGEHDEFGSALEVKEALGALGVHITVESVRGAGHLLEGHLGELQDIVRRFFLTGPGAEVLYAGRKGGEGGVL
jgi:predicted alpha/beta-hydrolase family hydrolase